MNAKALQREARLYFVPVILGNSYAANRLARKILFTYHISPMLAASKFSPWELLTPAFQKLRLFGSSSALICQQLVDLARGGESVLYILIPTTEEYRVLLEQNRTMLSAHFSISDPTRIFSDSPLSRIF